MNGTLALYTRTSLEDYDKAHQIVDQSCSIVNQMNVIRDFVRNDKELSEMHQVEYVDDGFTGTNLNRPRFQEMMEAAKLGNIQCIIVKDLSRLGRSYLEVGEYLEKLLPSLGIRLVAVTDGYDSKAFTGITGGIDVAFRNFIYDSYSKDLSEKVRSAMRTRMEKGKFVNQPPFGYMRSPEDKHQLIPNPETAPIVQEIFHLVNAGKKTTEIAKELNCRGVMTPQQYCGHKLKASCQGQEQRWSHITVLNILHNYKYTGAMVNHTRESRMLRDRNQRRTSPDEWIITEGAHEPLVTKEEFDSAHSKLRHPKKRDGQSGNGNDNVFFCGCCGHKLRKTHGLDTYFSCEAPLYKADSACANVRWSKTDLDGVLLPIYRVQLKLLGEKAIAIEQPSQPNLQGFIQEMRQIEKSIEHCDSQKIRLFEDYLDGKIDQETMRTKKHMLTELQISLREKHKKNEEAFHEKQREAERKRQEQDRLLEYLLDENLPIEKMTEKMYAAIDRVTVYDHEHIEVRWKFDDLFQDHSNLV